MIASTPPVGRRFMQYALRIALTFAAVVPFAAVAQAAPYISAVWGRLGTIEVSDSSGPVNLSGWKLATTDTDETLKLTSNTGFNAYPSTSRYSISFENFPTAGYYIDAHTLGGSVISQSPHDLDAGDWAYAIGLYDPLNNLRAFAQLRLAGSSATTLNTTMASQAVTFGLWSGVDQYIEFSPFNALYSPVNSTPTGPASYVGEPFPEPAALTLGGLAFLAAVATARRRSR